jgi:trk system potassium uptake protein TrkA
MNVIIVGCGRVGASLAKVLDTPENTVVIVDNDPDAFARLGGECQGRTVVGTGFDEKVLLDAGVDEADAFAAVTGRDNVNLMASEVARRLYDVPHVITRLIDPNRMDLYQRLGLDYVCDTEYVSENISSKIRARQAHHIDTFGDYEVLTFLLNTETVLHVRDLEDLGEIDVSLFEHDGDTYLAEPGMFLHDGDAVLAVVRTGDLPALAPYMKG